MKKEYVITRQGKEFVLYEGLLDECHAQGLKRIETTIYQVPTEENGNMAVVQAIVEVERGVFSGIGDAAPNSVNRMIVPHLLRMAETRAKARAMRDAVNVGATAMEELGDYDNDGGERTQRPGDDEEYSKVAAGWEQQGSELPKASPNKPASANQLATIAKLSRLMGDPEDPQEPMTSAEASDRISHLSRLYNEKKGASGRRSA